MNKKLFSVIKKEKDYCIIRDCETRAEFNFTYEQINTLFNKETPQGYLLSMDLDNPEIKKEMEKADSLIKRISNVFPTYLRMRKCLKDNMNDDVLMLSFTFGDMTTSICKDFGISLNEFSGIFRTMYFNMFGQYPESNETLVFKGELK